MENLLELIKRTTGLSPEVQMKILTSGGILLILLLLRTLLLRILWRRTDDVRTRYIWRKTVTYIVVAVSVLLVARVWFRGFQSIATFLGLVSAGLAIALKDVVTNIAGWVFIIVRRPFTLGDRIQVGSHAGDVIDIRVFQFTLMEIGNWVDADQSTGRVIHIPNGKVFSETLANYSQGFQHIWNEVPVLITFESDWAMAKEILQRIGSKHAEHLTRSAQRRIREASKKFMIFYSHLTPTVYTSVKESGVLLTIRYLCEPRRRRSSKQAIWEDILQEFAKCTDVDFAYPTQRFYHHGLEEKGRSRPSPERKHVRKARNGTD
jgi:small-conductance mechanosensitive channel